MPISVLNHSFSSGGAEQDDYAGSGQRRRCDDERAAAKSAINPVAIAPRGGVDERRPEGLSDDHQQSDRRDTNPAAQSASGLTPPHQEVATR